jgi:hypothetical protein
VVEGKFTLARREEYHQIMVGVMPETAVAMVQIAEATHVQPMRVVMRYLLAIVGLVVVAIAGIVAVAACLVPKETLAWVLVVALVACTAALYPCRSMLRDLLTKMLESKAGGDA